MKNKDKQTPQEKITAGVQQHLLIDEIKDGLLFLKDGSVHKILKAASINFYLRSEEEQSVIIGGFQETLNSLTFPIQILLQSRQIDLQGYLESINSLIANEADPILKANTESYYDFLKEIVSSASVMDKNFYIILSYYPAVISKVSMFDKLFGPSQKEVSAESQSLLEMTDVLSQRANSISMALSAIEVFCQELQTKEIIDLFYSTYNQDLVKVELPYDQLETKES